MSWDLPPGVTNKDIDERGEDTCPTCDGCEDEVGDTDDLNDDNLCETCAKELAAEMEERDADKETLE